MPAPAPASTWVRSTYGVRLMSAAGAGAGRMLARPSQISYGVDGDDRSLNIGNGHGSFEKLREDAGSAMPIW